MTKLALLLITISISTSLRAQQTFTKNQREVQNTVVKFFEAILNRDSVSLKTYSTSDISLYEYGQVWNIDTLIRKVITMNQAINFKRTNSFEIIENSTDKKLAWLKYRLNSVVSKDGKQTMIQWLETIVLTKEKKRWKVKHLHSTLIKRFENQP